MNNQARISDPITFNIGHLAFDYDGRPLDFKVEEDRITFRSRVIKALTDYVGMIDIPGDVVIPLARKIAADYILQQQEQQS